MQILSPFDRASPAIFGKYFAFYHELFASVYALSQAYILTSSRIRTLGATHCFPPPSLLAML